MRGKIAIFTLGCRVNHYESLAIEDSAKSLGFDIVKWGEKADFAIVNSCALTSLAEAKTRQSVRIFARENPNSSIAITGCYAQTSPDNLKELPNVKWIIGNSLKARCAEIILNNPPCDLPKIFADRTITASKEILNGASALSDRMNLKIQDGCDNACAYCIIPRARGIPRSRDFDEIVADAENLVARGVREIVITGINISKFSSSRGNLADLLDKLNDIKDLLRIRIGSIEPPDFGLESLLERITDPSHKLCPHLHISSQSLSDNVLSAMRRKYEAKEFLDTLEKIFNRSEDIAVGTDLICGFPSESEADFLETRKNLSNSGMAYAHVFTYSPRPKTLAATMPQLPQEIRKQRATLLRADAEKLRTSFIKRNTERQLEVLLENEVSNGKYLAYTDNYIQTLVNVGKPNMKNKLAIVKIETTKNLSSAPNVSSTVEATLLRIV